MMTETVDEKGCESQPLPEGNPTPKWTSEQLASYAQQQHQQIASSEEPLTSLYWRLGLALSVARAKFKHGKWGEYLQSLGIDKTRASKARAIHKACPKERDIANLSVAKAYARRHRKKARKAEPAVMSDKAELREFLKAVCIDAEKYFDVAAFLEPVQASEFVLDIENTIKKLEELCARARERAGERLESK